MAISESEIKLDARLFAVEHMLGNLYVHFYKAIRVSDAEVAAAHEKLLESMRTDSLGLSDPALNDLWASELHDAVERIVRLIEELRGQSQIQA
jgi:hypothetical protein